MAALTEDAAEGVCWDLLASDWSEVALLASDWLGSALLVPALVLLVPLKVDLLSDLLSGLLSPWCCVSEASSSASALDMTLCEAASYPKMITNLLALAKTICYATSKKHEIMGIWGKGGGEGGGGAITEAS